RDAQRSVLRAGDELTAEAVAHDVAELGAAARAALGEPDAALAVTHELRYRGQAFELAVGAAPDAAPDELREAFEAAHEERYGYRDPQQPLELVTVRVSATTAAPDVAGATATASDERAPGDDALAGPTVVPLPESTLVIPAGWRGTVREDGAIDVRRDAGGRA
ncbi:MAG TPA: hypothetical protein VFV85_04320, partial [Conexibacter sp.]|nr:hypothetical protein [Conexibacter sp.]